MVLTLTPFVGKNKKARRRQRFWLVGWGMSRLTKAGRGSLGSTPAMQSRGASYNATTRHQSTADTESLRAKRHPKNPRHHVFLSFFFDVIFDVFSFVFFFSPVPPLLTPTPRNPGGPIADTIHWKEARHQHSLRSHRRFRFRHPAFASCDTPPSQQLWAFHAPVAFGDPPSSGTPL